ARRICREAPAPIVDVARRTDAPGGAANTAANVAALGARTTLLAVTGDDAEGDALRRALARADVSLDGLLTVRRRQTLAKHRVFASSHLLVRFDQGRAEPLDAGSERTLIARLRALYASMDAIVVSDYAYGVIAPALLRELATLRRKHPRTVVVDSRNLPLFRHLRPTAVKPNYDEAVRLLGAGRVEGPDARAEQMMSEGPRLLDMTGADIAAITLDTDGALIFERGAPPYRTYAQRADGTRAAGAGDTFVAALALALAAGAGATVAAEIASTAAAVVVARDGTSACSAADLRGRLAAGGKFAVDLARLRSHVQAARERGQRIVFTNGCFDILHRGHITYLNRAKALGDVLIVGVNSDASVAALKGPGRPVNTLEDRVEVLGALSCVDHVVAFDEATPERLIRALRPDIYVKGGDYTIETLPEAPLVESLGGAVRLLPFVEDRSTTRIIERIRGTDAPGGDTQSSASARRRTRGR
ncbi:MAG TPA: D-glycero-beta-D-manno-heptose 1-phosphate adenylyltransferase, partial [Dehalococcoidia bacterium]|nr:D-glycero-beta-D-manno-heptose 1-phosphate adenylyltransferase [Dehalococcoidia bacterium]